MTWKITVSVFNKVGQPTGEAQTIFDVSGPFLSLGVHCSFIATDLAFQKAVWDGHAPGVKEPIPFTYEYADEQGGGHPTKQVKLYWLLRSKSSGDPATLALEFQSGLTSGSTPVIACIADAVANGSTAIHDDPALIIESRMMFPTIHGMSMGVGKAQGRGLS